MQHHQANWERYMGVWGEADPEKRVELLKEVLDPAATYTDPVTERPLSGYQAISGYIEQTQKMIPGIRLEITSYEEHHDVSLAGWDMFNADGVVLSRGKSFARYGADEKIKETVAFFS